MFQSCSFFSDLRAFLLFLLTTPTLHSYFSTPPSHQKMLTLGMTLAEHDKARPKGGSRKRNSGERLDRSDTSHYRLVIALVCTCLLFFQLPHLCCCFPHLSTSASSFLFSLYGDPPGKSVIHCIPTIFKDLFIFYTYDLFE